METNSITKGTARNRRRTLKRLFHLHSGNCHWCKTPTILGKVGGNRATVDHLKTVREGRVTYEDGGVVLACHSCNHGRNKEENKKYITRSQTGWFVLHRRKNKFIRLYRIIMIPKTIIGKNKIITRTHKKWICGKFVSILELFKD